MLWRQFAPVNLMAVWIIISFEIIGGFTMSEIPQLVLSRYDGTVLTLTLNRPERSNSLHPDLVAQLSAALAQVEIDGERKVVVITGAGSTFCAGLDLELLLKWSTDQKLAYLDTVIKVFRRIWLLPQPVIAA